MMTTRTTLANQDAHSPSCGRGLPIPLVVIFALLATITPSCGGASGGEAAGRGLSLMNFSHDGVDNAVLNQVLFFEFSGNVAPATITQASIQIREGPAFGASVAGTYIVDGATVRFEPRLPTLCDLSDGAFEPDTQYRVQVIGFPEEFAIRNTAGQALFTTSTHEFHTRVESDPTKYADQIPGVGPTVLSKTPDNAGQAVTVAADNKVEIVMSENLNPCTVDDSTVRFYMYETGNPDIPSSVAAPNTHLSGFYAGSDTSDQSPADQTAWGADVSTTYAPPQKILAHIELIQSLAETRIVITPLSGWSPDPTTSAPLFPENALLVVDLTFGITDFGNLPLTPETFSFTTQNLPTQNGTYTMEAAGETPFLKRGTTADVNSSRAPSRVQGYLVFAGDGDNGVDLEVNSGPNTPASGCTSPFQVKDGVLDDFDATADMLLDTGASLNTCNNQTDGSTAVTFEFNSFRIRGGATVRVVGVNPAIIKVSGDVTIDASGTLFARGDGKWPHPKGFGGRGSPTYGIPKGVKGGEGVAGGGNGGDSENADNVKKYGQDGYDGFGSDDFGMQGGDGSGHGNVNAVLVSHNQGPTRNAGAGGGGGNATNGEDGGSLGTGSITVFAGPTDGIGGSSYGTGDEADRLLVPFAGSGGGASGAGYSSYTDERCAGGAGGAGGGFVDITAAGDVRIHGTIDAAGGKGGRGTLSPWGQEHESSGGGGGGGGGIRILTPRDITVSGGTLTAAGGLGGVGAVGTVYPGPRNNGGAGGNGRIVLEDSDSVIAGLGGATVSPGEGEEGFYRGVFDGTRFKGGGTMPLATSDIFPVGPLNPTYSAPVQADFTAGIPTIGSRGVGKTSLFIEAQGFQMKTDGTVDLPSATGWKTVGYFKDSSIENAPVWVPDAAPGDVTLPTDNTGGTLLSLNGREFIQLRFTIYLPSGVGPDDAGPYVDTWHIRFQSNQ